MSRSSSKPSSSAARALLPMFVLLIIGGTRFVSRPTQAAPQPVAVAMSQPRVTLLAPPTASPIARPAAQSQAAVASLAPTVAAAPAATAPVKTAAATATTAPVAQPPAAALPPKAMIDGIVHQQQTWNNCGPANMSMLLQHHGRRETQRDTAKFLKPVRDDKNVSPSEMVAYAESLGFRARWIVGADIALIKRFVAADLPVVAESWFIPHPNDEMGHYELIHGYDGDDLIADDSYQGPNQRFSAAEWDKLWRVFNRTLVVVWRADQDALAQTLLGERWEPARMHAIALETARREVEANPADAFAWFNLGTSLLATGDAAGATTAFDKADEIKLPWRMLWYQHGPFEANYLVGDHDKVIKLTTRALKTTGDLEESYYWRGRAYQALNKKNEARRDFSIAVKLNANYAAALVALR